MHAAFDRECISAAAPCLVRPCGAPVQEEHAAGRGRRQPTGPAAAREGSDGSYQSAVVGEGQRKKALAGRVSEAGWIDAETGRGQEKSCGSIRPACLWWLVHAGELVSLQPGLLPAPVSGRGHGRGALPLRAQARRHLSERRLVRGEAAAGREDQQLQRRHLWPSDPHQATRQVVRHLLFSSSLWLPPALSGSLCA